MRSKGEKAEFIFFRYIEYQRKGIIMFFIAILIFTWVFYLNNLPIEIILYAAELCFFMYSIVGVIDFLKFRKKHQQMVYLKNEINLGLENLTLPKDLLEKDYQELLRVIHQDKVNLLSEADSKNSDMIEYYTMWIHQIKTPIAAMHLLLQAECKEENSTLSMELFKIEQYVEMVLSYIRLGTDTNDLLIRRMDLDKLIKQSIRKYAKLFISKKIRVDLEEINYKVLTDEKWLLFVMEQILSNSLKYTKSGTIKIYMEGTKLVIEDTGIGIAPEDLQRVFEKGYTSYNGRLDKKSTGIGLYLCHRILKKLGHGIEISSQIGIGTKVFIELSTYEIFN